MVTAGTERKVVDCWFALDRQKLSDALGEALESGEPFVESLDFQGADAERYEEAMLNTLYELTPYIWENQKATASTGKQKQALELRIFASMGNELVDDVSGEWDAGDLSSYVLEERDGFQGFYFLLVNDTDREQSAVIQIDEKATEIIRVMPHNEVELEDVESERTASISYHEVNSVTAPENIFVATSANAAEANPEKSEPQKENGKEMDINSSNPDELNPEDSNRNEWNLNESDAEASLASNSNVTKPSKAETSKTESSATESNATESNASESNAVKEVLDGALFDAVRFGSYSAVLFAVTWEEVGFDFFGMSTLENNTAATVNTVSADEALGVTIRMFDYDARANNEGLGLKGYKFFHDKKTYGPAKDGDDSTMDRGDYNFPNMKPLLLNGYPNTTEGSMEYLFKAGVSYYRGEAKDGGGLFQKDDNGYYYYDSMKNAAYFDTGSSEFVLYDCVVRPQYTSQNGSDVEKSNFLPFNVVQGNVIADKGEPSTVQTGAKTTKLCDLVNLWFGMTVEFDFMMPKDGKVNGQEMKFDFHGDDDVFVYIDDVLVLDIGGTHAAESASIDFVSGKAEDPRGNKGGKTLKEIFSEAGKTIDDFKGNTFGDYTMHKLKFFYMERGGNISYCRLKFNMPTLPEKSLTVEKQLTAKETADFFGDTSDYQFRVMQANASGQILEQLFLPAGTEFVIQEENTNVGTGVIGSDGTFSLKAGQKALFSDMLKKSEQHGCYYYAVQEIIPENLVGQYESVEYQVIADGGSASSGGKDKNGLQNDSVISTGMLSAECTQYVIYKNEVDTSKLSYLKISKEKTPGTIFADGQKFDIQVKLGGRLLPKGTQYKVGMETRTVETDGILKLGVSETAEILSGILAGTTYEICEVIPEGADYKAAYTGQTSGRFAPGSVIFITVTNSDYDLCVKIPIQKTTIGFADSKKRTFYFKVEPCNEKGEVSATYKPHEGTSVTLLGNGIQRSEITIGYKEKPDPTGTYYYKVSEAAYDSEEIICDQTHYIAEIKVANKKATLEAVYVLDKSGNINKINSNILSFTNVNSTSAVVSKRVQGNMMDDGKQFTFKAVLTDGTEGAALGNAVYAFNGSNECTFTLKHGDTCSLKKLPVGAVLTITEESSDYTVTYQIDGGTETSGSAAKAILSAGHQSRIDFINTKTTKVDTGIRLDGVVYAMTLGAAATGLILLFLITGWKAVIK